MRQAARQLGVHESTVRRYADRGLIAAMRLPSGVRRLRRADVDALALRSQPPHGPYDLTADGQSPAKTIDALAAEQGIGPLADISQLATPGVWLSDEEADRFIVLTHAERDRDR